MISALLVPSRAQAMVASIELVMSSDARRSLPSSSGVLIARSRSSTPVASTKRAPSSRSPSSARASEGRKPGSMPMRAPPLPMRCRCSAAIAAASSVPEAAGWKLGVQNGRLACSARSMRYAT